VKRSSPEPDFVCPHCGEELPGGSKSCPECGSDERTGWSEDTYLDGISLPGGDDDEEDEPTPAKGVFGPGRLVWVAVAVGLLAVAVGFRLLSLR
jgi:hypothetical protein